MRKKLKFLVSMSTALRTFLVMLRVTSVVCLAIGAPLAMCLIFGVDVGFWKVRGAGLYFVGMAFGLVEWAIIAMLKRKRTASL
jgi:hypothetical protein